MNTNTANDNWRPKPWLAAVLGLISSGAGLLYVQRPWWAVAAYVVPLLAALGLLYAMWQFDLYVNLWLFVLSGWTVSIACAVYGFKVAVATPAGAARRWYSRWPALVAVILAVYVLIFLVRAFVFEDYRTPAQSMHPTIPENSFLFVAKPGFGNYTAYGFTIWRGTPTATISRGDIVAHRLASDLNTTYVKRVVGLPGDRIEYTNNRLVINGNTVPQRLEARDDMYQYAIERLDGHEVTIALLPERPSRDWAGTVPPDHYFVLGDNRANSRDSRFAEVGFVARDHIVGRVVKIVKEPGR